jgi:ABC-type polysaccharide/polyol phosphate export permease
LSFPPIEIARRIGRHRGLLAALTARELKARYRGSVLGFFWSLVQPLLLLAVYSFVFGLVFEPRAAGAEPYALFLVCGLFPWIWLATSLSEGTVSLVASAGLIRRAVFPAELLPIVPVASNLVHLLFAMPVVALGVFLALRQGYEVGGPGALALPGIVLLQLPAIAGVSLALAALHAHFKDVKDILANLLTLGFFLTPVLYPLAAVSVPALARLVRFNPVTPFTLAYQEALFAGSFPRGQLWLEMAIVAVVCWSAGAILFERLRETLVEAL